MNKKTRSGLGKTGRAIKHLPHNILRLQEHLQVQEQKNSALEKQIIDNANGLRTLFQLYENQLKQLEEVKSYLRSFDNRLSDLGHQFNSVESSLNKKSNKSGDAKSELQADDHILDNFYVMFENHFRGSEEDIKKRQKDYLKYFKESSLDSTKYPVLDIGCGRGEFIELLNEHGLKGIGIDLNESMVKLMQSKSLEAHQDDALSYLHKQKSNSYMAITGFHIVEHIPFATLLRIFSECYRVIAPGGFVIFETPNPENIRVGAYSFYMDPSHLNPLPPTLLEFSLDTRGFNKIRVLRLHPSGEKTVHKDPSVQMLLEHLHGPQDYAVIGYK